MRQMPGYSPAWSTRRIRAALHTHKPTIVTTHAGGAQEARCECGEHLGYRTPTPGAIEAHQPPYEGQ